METKKLKFQEKNTFFCIALFFLTCMLFACSAEKMSLRHDKKSRDLLLKYLEGDFNNQEQANEDAEKFLLVDIHIRRIWQNREKKYIWLYLEQALPDKPEDPFRQRIYKVYNYKPKLLALEPYLLKAPGAFIGAYKKVNLFDAYSVEDLLPSPDCTLYFTQNGANFTGKMEKDRCKNYYNDGSFVESEVSITATGIINHDIGKAILSRRKDGTVGNTKTVWGKSAQYVYKKTNH